MALLEARERGIRGFPWGDLAAKIEGNSSICAGKRVTPTARTMLLLKLHTSVLSRKYVNKGVRSSAGWNQR